MYLQTWAYFQLKIHQMLNYSLTNTPLHSRMIARATTTADAQPSLVSYPDATSFIIVK